MSPAGLTILLVWYFSVVFIFAIVMLRKVHQIYGATGATFAKAMNEGQSTIGNTLWTNEHVRNAAQTAATQAAQHTAQVRHFSKKKKIEKLFF